MAWKLIFDNEGMGSLSIIKRGKIQVSQIQGGNWYLEITSPRNGKNWFMPSQPKSDLQSWTKLLEKMFSLMCTM